MRDGKLEVMLAKDLKDQIVVIEQSKISRDRKAAGRNQSISR